METIGRLPTYNLVVSTDGMSKRVQTRNKLNYCFICNGEIPNGVKCYYCDLKKELRCAREDCWKVKCVSAYVDHTDWYCVLEVLK